jgi:hypothetical protein
MIIFIIVKIFRVKSEKLLGFNLKHFKGKRVQVTRAPEPTDIFWENLNLSLKQRIKRIFFTYLMTFLLLVFALAVNIGVHYLKIWI